MSALAEGDCSDEELKFAKAAFSEGKDKLVVCSHSLETRIRHWTVPLTINFGMPTTIEEAVQQMSQGGSFQTDEFVAHFVALMDRSSRRPFLDFNCSLTATDRLIPFVHFWAAGPMLNRIGPFKEVAIE